MQYISVLLGFLICLTSSTCAAGNTVFQFSGDAETTSAIPLQSEETRNPVIYFTLSLTTELEITTVDEKATLSDITRQELEGSGVSFDLNETLVLDESKQFIVPAQAAQSDFVIPNEIYCVNLLSICCLLFAKTVAQLLIPVVTERYVKNSTHSSPENETLLRKTAEDTATANQAAMNESIIVHDATEEQLDDALKFLLELADSKAGFDPPQLTEYIDEEDEEV